MKIRMKADILSKYFLKNLSARTKPQAKRIKFDKASNLILIYSTFPKAKGSSYHHEESR